MQKELLDKPFHVGASAWCFKCRKECEVVPPLRAPLGTDNDEVDLSLAARPWVTNHAGHTC
eukprot:10039714-Lingulodinium_polyedra.AAC.1